MNFYEILKPIFKIRNPVPDMTYRPNVFGVFLVDVKRF